MLYTQCVIATLHLKYLSRWYDKSDPNAKVHCEL